jgi:hypothetical protein
VSLKRWVRCSPPRDESGQAEAPRFVRLEVTPSTSARTLTVEVGEARIVVEPGFEAEHLRAVVAALGGRTP